jgi:hypothetical protein
MWLYNNTEFTEEMIDNNVGFVYIIMNLTNGKKYIGKKLFTKSKIYQKNKKKKRTRISSNWIEYTGSNDALNEDVKNGNHIVKHIIHLCTSKGWCSYYETKEIFNNNALIDENFYNSWVSCRIRRTHLK